jgi:hypothetical protein
MPKKGVSCLDLWFVCRCVSTLVLARDAQLGRVAWLVVEGAEGAACLCVMLPTVPSVCRRRLSFSESWRRCDSRVRRGSIVFGCLRLPNDAGMSETFDESFVCQGREGKQESSIWIRAEGGWIWPRARVQRDLVELD